MKLTDEDRANIARLDAAARDNCAEPIDYYTDGLRAGMMRGVTLYAHWKDGVQYVGTCGRTLKKALAEIQEQS